MNAIDDVNNNLVLCSNSKKRCSLWNQSNYFLKIKSRNGELGTECVAMQGMKMETLLKHQKLHRIAVEMIN